MKEVSKLYGVLAVLCTVAAIAACIAGAVFGTVYAEPAENPEDTVKAFFNDIETGDYESAYALLSNVSTLGLENENTGEVAEHAMAALRDSYSFTLQGNCRRDGFEAMQIVTLTSLDLEAYKGFIVNAMEESRKAAEAEAALTAGELDFGLESSSKEPEIEVTYPEGEELEALYRTEQLSVSLQFDPATKSWYISADDALISAICGYLK